MPRVYRQLRNGHLSKQAGSAPANPQSDGKQGTAAEEISQTL